MGQTLTHGVYLPDEGERNCYNGLASNWSILDGAVGTIAEHTTALAGKAPAVHTHTKSDVTDFPAFGNAAGTICEGNDSRLSDARTPVAHTHTKSDVTDLLNSNFIPSANNFYDLGSSNYQWNNVYSKNYFYNGVAWGLDKINTWTNRNIYENDSVTIRDNNIQDTTAPDSDVGKGIFEVWSKDNHYWGGLGYKWLANGNSELVIALSNWNSNTQGYWEYKIGVNKAFNDLYFAPPHNLVNLGTSSNKWKTINGINPGALSLPNLASDGYIELSDNISANTEYAYTPTVDGWLALYCQTTGFHAENSVAIFNGSESAYRWACSATSGINLARLDKYHGAVILPVRAGIPYLCWIKIDSSTTLTSKTLYFYKATGNV